MRVIHSSSVAEAVRGLCVNASCALPEDVLAAIKAARDIESGPAKAVLEQILKNEAISRVSRRPCCQDTGLAVVFIDVGTDIFIEGDIVEAVNAGVRSAYSEAYLRKSCLSALERENTGDNTPAILHTRYIPGNKLRIDVAPKGFGSENMSRLKMLTPSMGIDGVMDFIIETAELGAQNACPPVILGVGVGGTLEAAALLAKRQLLREVGKKGETELIASMEQKALNAINALNIGPMGMGGRTTALAVHIAQTPTHLAGLPVAVNVQCHCARHAGAVL